MLLRYFLNDIQKFSVAPVVTGITFVFTLHTLCIYIILSLYMRIFSVSCLMTFLSPEITMYIKRHAHSLLSRIMMSSSCYWGWCCQFSLVDSIILHSWLLSTKFGTCLYNCFFGLIHKRVVGPTSSWAFSLSCPFMYCSFASLLLSLLSPLCRLFTIIYLKQTTFIRYGILQLFCSYNRWCTLCNCAGETCFVLVHYKETKLRIHNLTAKAALKFGSEAWVLKEKEEQRLEAAQMKFLRHLLGITKLHKKESMY